MAARRNLSWRSNVDLSSVHARGAFKLVYKATYSTGPRKGEHCVSKVFKSGSVYEDAYFQTDLDVTSTAMTVVNKFNNGGFIDKSIRLNEPEVWVFVSGPHSGQKNLVEPYISGYQKFNSNTGWMDDGTAWGEVMQALSHFSYHTSGGSLVLCDLQGGVYSNGVVLTDPVIMSNERKYGPTDLGRMGIQTFFARHTCNKYCRRAQSSSGAL